MNQRLSSVSRAHGGKRHQHRHWRAEVQHIGVLRTKREGVGYTCPFGSPPRWWLVHYIPIFFNTIRIILNLIVGISFAGKSKDRTILIVVKKITWNHKQSKTQEKSSGKLHHKRLGKTIVYESIFQATLIFEPSLPMRKK